jgi:3-hydroxybutyryl-CoA dehydratase
MTEQLRRRRFACTPAVVEAWAELAHDRNPLHLDPQFAASTPFGVPIAQGHLLAAVVANEVEAAVGERLTAGGSVSVAFRAPVPVGSTVEVLTLGGGEAAAWSRASVAGSDVLRIEIEEAR